MFDIGLPEFLILAVAALFIFGPERLPVAAQQAARVIKQVRAMANNARTELGKELGPEFANLSLEDLNPRTFVRKQLLEGTGLDTLKNDIGLSKSDFDLNAEPQRERDPLDFWTRPPADFDAT
jgi:sec-independent protein translocase protein TatB